MQKSNLPAVAKMKIDIKSMDEQLERHMDRVICLMEKKKEPEEWEIDPHKLVLKGVFAKGGFAKVRRGVYDGQEVAVKVLECGEERDFRGEVSLWYTLDHPNVTKCIGATTPNSSKKFGDSNKEETRSPISDSLCIVTEYMSGGNLKSHLLRRKNMKLPYETVLQLALDLARGLDYLHSKKIVHMDIKTENLLLDNNGMLKIADFGFARIEAPQMKGETGTRGYMAPEILESKPYTKKCDVYSFGICLWEIVCCQESYSNISRSELDNVDKYKTLRPRIPKGCPSSLSTLMKRCWDAEPSRRPETKEVVAILESLHKSNQPRGCFCF